MTIIFIKGFKQRFSLFFCYVRMNHLHKDYKFCCVKLIISWCIHFFEQFLYVNALLFKNILYLLDNFFNFFRNVNLFIILQLSSFFFINRMIEHLLPRKSLCFVDLQTPLDKILALLWNFASVRKFHRDSWCFFD